MGLFKPAYMNKNTAKAVEAVRKISDQEKLKGIIGDYTVAEEVRVVAVERLSDKKELFRILCDGKIPPSIRKAAVPGLSQEALIAFAMMDGVRFDTTGVLDMVLSRIPDKKVVAQTMWMQKKQCKMLHRLGYTEEDVIKVAQSYPAGSLQYLDCTDYAYDVRSLDFSIQLTKIMAAHPVNKNNPFFDKDLMVRIQQPDRTSFLLDYAEEVKAQRQAGAVCSSIALDWLLARKNNHELIESPSAKSAIRFVTKDEDRLTIIREIPELFHSACSSLSNTALKENGRELVETALQLKDCNVYYMLFSRLKRLGVVEADELILPRQAVIDYNKPSYEDISFILELDEDRCTDQVIRLLEAGASSANLLERMEDTLVLGHDLPVNVKALEKSGNPIIKRFAVSLRKMLAEEYKKAIGQHSLSDHTGVSEQQDRDIHEAYRIRFKQK